MRSHRSHFPAALAAVLLLSMLSIPRAADDTDLYGEFFHRALYTRDMSVLREFVENRGLPIKDTITSGEWKGYDVVLMALITVNPPALSYLADKGAPLNGTFPTGPHEGMTPLMYVSLFDMPELLDLLLEKGAELNRVHPVRGTALHIALGGRFPAHARNAQRLLDKGADIQAAIPLGERAGFTPLMAAVEGGHVELVDALIKKGARLDARATGGLYRGFTPGMLARSIGEEKMIALFRAANDPSLENPSEPLPLAELRACRVDSDCARVTTECCGCAMGGGGDIAVNKKRVEYYYRHYFRKTCKNKCALVYLCSTEPACEQGLCVQREPSDEDTRTNTKVVPNITPPF